ncbi:MULTISPECIES: hypothetical protein [Flagellimonas]|uniref:Uncharacterized protein n=1 Tax=Flagellimonas hadalis TaxID=2597517 RepID=A0A5N5IVD6_9FLAO|nr:hypothetical protein [Allomuricauda hadalis]KAB5491765.1 hypothetical protein FOT42_002095 [Allomuricauda hadalis]
MKLSQNIIYDSKGVQESNFEFHTKQLEIVSLNLDDFNSRLKSNIKLNYNHKLNVFLLESDNEQYGGVFVRHIAHCLAFYNDDNWVEDSFIIRDLYNIRNTMINLFYHIKYDVDHFKQDDSLNSELRLFIGRFDNEYCPLGILSPNGSQYYKQEVQKIVDELKSVLHFLDK